jgi:hypothetical protein
MLWRKVSRSDSMNLIHDLLRHDMDRNPLSVDDDAMPNQMFNFLGVPCFDASDVGELGNYQGTAEAYMTMSARSPSASTMFPSQSR